MCHSADARPPLPPIRGGSTGSQDLTLTAADGNRFMAHGARAAQPTGAGMVILPDVRGLHTFYKELAQRFAEAGIDAVAIDYFGRTAGLGSRDESFVHMPHVEKTTREGVAADVGAAAAYMRTAEGGRVRAVFTVGFCFGGANSWAQSAAGHDLSGVIGFYGRPSRVRDLIPRMRVPLLLLVAGNDASTPPEEFQRFDRELTDAGVDHCMVVYPGAPHSFFDRTAAQHQDAASDAWHQILAFVRERGAEEVS
jgi:carboxymethylenebutenolidase